MCTEANTSMETGQKLLSLKHKLINSGRTESGFQTRVKNQTGSEWRVELDLEWTEAMRIQAR